MPDQIACEAAMLTLETTVTSLTVVTQSKVFCWTQAIEPASRSRGLQWAEWTVELQTGVREDFPLLWPSPS